VHGQTSTAGFTHEKPHRLRQTITDKTDLGVRMQITVRLRQHFRIYMLHPDSRARGRFAAKLPLLPTSTFRQRFRILTVALAAGICLSVTLEIYAAPRLQSGRFAAKLALLPTIPTRSPSTLQLQLSPFFGLRFGGRLPAWAGASFDAQPTNMALHLTKNIGPVVVARICQKLYYGVCKRDYP
jgi:hypothetical protein